MSLQTDYIPSVHDAHTYQAWETIKYAVARSREHEAYLTNKQLAMAIFMGLCVYSMQDDAPKVAYELADLMSTHANEAKKDLPF